MKMVTDLKKPFNDRHEITVTFRLTGEFRFRLWLGTRLLIMAVRVMGMSGDNVTFRYEPPCESEGRQ